MFSMEQNVWIVTDGVKIKKVKIKKEFVMTFNISPNESSKLHGHYFVRFMTNFKPTRCVKREKPKV